MAISREQSNPYRMGDAYPPYQLGQLTAGGFSTAPRWWRGYYKGTFPPAITYDTAFPTNPTLETGSDQYTNLVHAWPVMPVDDIAEDKVASQHAGETNDPLTTSSTEFGDTPNMTTGRPTASDADYYFRNSNFTPGWDQDGPVTLSLWFRPERFVQFGQHMFYPGDEAAGANRFWIGCQPHFGASDAQPQGVPGAGKGRKDKNATINVYFYIRSGGTGADTDNVLHSIEHPQFKAVPDQWNHMVAAYDRNAGTYKLWMNGVEVPKTGPRWFDNTASCTDWSAAFDSIGIGGAFRGGASAGASVQGSAIDFRIYDTVLSQAQVDAMYATSTRWELWGGVVADEAVHGGSSWRRTYKRKTPKYYGDAAREAYTKLRTLREKVEKTPAEDLDLDISIRAEFERVALETEALRELGKKYQLEAEQVEELAAKTFQAIEFQKKRDRLAQLKRKEAILQRLEDEEAILLLLMVT